MNSLSEIHSGQDEQGGDFGRFSGIVGNKRKHLSSTTLRACNLFVTPDTDPNSKLEDVEASDLSSPSDTTETVDLSRLGVCAAVVNCGVVKVGLTTLSIAP